jgi:hypothetical protein
MDPTIVKSKEFSRPQGIDESVLVLKEYLNRTRNQKAIHKVQYPLE